MVKSPTTPKVRRYTTLFLAFFITLHYCLCLDLFGILSWLFVCFWTHVSIVHCIL